MEKSVSGLGQKVLRDFPTFPETNFKRKQVPRRRVPIKTDVSFRCVILLRGKVRQDEMGS
jgi:hypothetical protein